LRILRCKSEATGLIKLCNYEIRNCERRLVFLRLSHEDFQINHELGKYRNMIITYKIDGRVL
jgi:hypothetical protein